MNDPETTGLFPHVRNPFSVLALSLPNGISTVTPLIVPRIPRLNSPNGSLLCASSQGEKLVTRRNENGRKLPDENGFGATLCIITPVFPYLFSCGAFTKCDMCINPPSPNPIHRIYIATGNSRAPYLVSREKKLKFFFPSSKISRNLRSLFVFVTLLRFSQKEKENKQLNI